MKEIVLNKMKEKITKIDSNKQTNNQTNKKCF